METKKKKYHERMPVMGTTGSLPAQKKGTGAGIIPPVRLEPALRKELLTQVLEEGFVTVHCAYQSWREDKIRIWNSTYLIDKATGRRSKLLHAENITFFPVWMDVPDFTEVTFTLFFEPLPKSCQIFDLFEDIPESGGFKVSGILRNDSDVYTVEIS